MDPNLPSYSAGHHGHLLITVEGGRARLEEDPRTEVLAVYDDRTDQFLGEITLELWRQWSLTQREGVLEDMFTWLPCERDEPQPPNTKGVIERLAAIGRRRVA